MHTYVSKYFLSQVSTTDELPSLCDDIPKAELYDFCKNSRVWFKCKNTCKQNYPTARDYNGKVLKIVKCLFVEARPMVFIFHDQVSI